MSILELEQQAEVSDFQPHCPVKLAELNIMTPIAPEAVSPDLGPGTFPYRRMWQYRVCGMPS